MRASRGARAGRRGIAAAAVLLALVLAAGCSRWQPGGGDGVKPESGPESTAAWSMPESADEESRADGGSGPSGGVAPEAGAGDSAGGVAPGAGAGDSAGDVAPGSGDSAGDRTPGAGSGDFAGDQTPCAEIIHRDQGEELDPIKLPAAYDYRKVGRAPQIGNQGSLGTCWAFASLKALESSLLPGKRLELSVDHMSMHNSFSLPQDAGGEYTMSMAYLLAWQGPVLESEDPYGDGYSPDGLSPCMHVQEIQILPPKDYEAIKRAVYRYGGVQSSLFTSMRNYQSESVYYNRQTNSYCYIGDEKPNHDSVIIGWDDNYPKENFNMGLEGDGAFICTNSWGEDFGDQGYFYVSYYDTNIGVHNIVYTGVEPVNNYGNIYQSDLCGWVGQIGYGRDSAWFANAYQAKGAETLEAAGFYATDQNSSYEIYVARRLSGQDGGGLNSRVKVAEGKFRYAGFYTVPLDRKIVLDDGEKFAIIVKITTPGTIHPVAIEYDAGDGIAEVDLSDGEGYLSYDGQSWEHVEETQKCNVCLKAYTSGAKDSSDR